MVRVSRLATFFDVECELLAKVKPLNAGRSVKGRLGRRMVKEAEKGGRIKSDDVLIEVPVAARASVSPGRRR